MYENAMSSFFVRKPTIFSLMMLYFNHTYTRKNIEGNAGVPVQTASMSKKRATFVLTIFSSKVWRFHITWYFTVRRVKFSPLVS